MGRLLSVLAVTGLAMCGCGEIDGGDDCVFTGLETTSAVDEAVAAGDDVLEAGDVAVEPHDVATGDDDLAATDYPACAEGATTQRITFVHVNDLHASYMLAGEQGETSWARVAGYAKAQRAINPYTIFTDGGDDHEKGAIAEQLSGGHSTIEAVRAMNFDVRVIGNHDFAWGPEELLEFTHDDHAEVLCSNTRYLGEEPEAWGAVPWAEIQVGCVRVGFFGLHPHPYNELNESYEGPYFPGNTDFETRYDYETLVREILEEHRSGVDYVVMLSHLGAGTDRELAEAVDGIDLILGAHSHTTMAGPEVVGDTRIVQCGADGLFIGRVDVDFDLTEASSQVGYELVLNLEGAVDADPATQAAIEDIVNEFAPLSGEPAARVKGGARSIAEVAALGALQVAQADAALIWNETIWTGWAPGGLSVQQMLDIFKVERQPAGTSGFSSLQTVEVDGGVLGQIASSVPAGFAYVGPAAPESGRTYVLAVQKGPAMNPSRFFGEGVAFGAPGFVSEMWYVMYRYGAERLLNCTYIDSDETFEDCGWPE